MPGIRRSLILFTIISICLACSKVNQISRTENYGQIQGKVLDKYSGDPLPGVNISVSNSLLGAATDVDGSYIITKVPVGKVTLNASFIGYQSVNQTNIIVNEGKSTVVNFELNESSVEGEEVTIVASRPLVEKSVTTSVQLITSYPESNSEEYSKIEENGFINVLKSPVSTFAADIDGASYANVRRFLNDDRLPYKDAVRTEEFINYFSYNYPTPTSDNPLSIHFELSECPWKPENQLLHVGLTSRNLPIEDLKKNNLVFLLDVSGSMSAPNKLPLLKNAFKLLVDQLKPNDQVAVVVYAGQAGVVLHSTPVAKKQTIIASIDKLEASGSTAGAEGIELAYKIASENFIKEGNNRVILATDGDFNVGISSTSKLVSYIEEKRNTGIFFTALGFGMGNYKDDRLQELARHGNGQHAYIDNIQEAKKVLVNEISSTLYTVAKDVKIQLEFNPAHVKSYRLIGYENRLLNEEDFEDDTKDAGEVGIGHSVTALYEIIPTGKTDELKNDYTYQTTKIKDKAKYSDDKLTLRIRYKSTDGDKSREMSQVLNRGAEDFNACSADHQFAAAVAQFAMLLRNSEFKGNSSYQSTYKIASNALGEDDYGYRQEFLTLLKKAESLGLEQ